MKHILFFSTFFLIFNLTGFSQNKKAYIKHIGETPKKFIISELLSHKFPVEYKSKKASTAYLELLKNGESLANDMKSVKSRKPQKISFTIRTYKKVKKLTPGLYTLKLILFEGEAGNFDKKLSEVILKNIRLSRL